MLEFLREGDEGGGFRSLRIVVGHRLDALDHRVVVLRAMLLVEGFVKREVESVFLLNVVGFLFHEVVKKCDTGEARLVHVELKGNGVEVLDDLRATVALRQDLVVLLYGFDVSHVHGVWVPRVLVFDDELGFQTLNQPVGQVLLFYVALHVRQLRQEVLVGVSRLLGSVRL